MKYLDTYKLFEDRYKKSRGIFGKILKKLN